jgi:hypothetical protein
MKTGGNEKMKKRLKQMVTMLLSVMMVMSTVTVLPSYADDGYSPEISKISANYTDDNEITVEFPEGDNITASADVKSKIKISNNYGDTFTYLSDSDSVSTSDNKVIIHLSDTQNVTEIIFENGAVANDGELLSTEVRRYVNTKATISELSAEKIPAAGGKVKVNVKGKMLTYSLSFQVFDEDGNQIVNKDEYENNIKEFPFKGAYLGDYQYSKKEGSFTFEAPANNSSAEKHYFIMSKQGYYSDPEKIEDFTLTQAAGGSSEGTAVSSVEYSRTSFGSAGGELKVTIKGNDLDGEIGFQPELKSGDTALTASDQEKTADQIVLTYSIPENTASNEVKYRFRIAKSAGSEDYYSSTEVTGVDQDITVAAANGTDPQENEKKVTAAEIDSGASLPAEGGKAIIKITGTDLKTGTGEITYSIYKDGEKIDAETLSPSLNVISETEAELTLAIPENGSTSQHKYSVKFGNNAEAVSSGEITVAGKSTEYKPADGSRTFELDTDDWVGYDMGRGVVKVIFKKQNVRLNDEIDNIKDYIYFGTGYNDTAVKLKEEDSVVIEDNVMTIRFADKNTDLIGTPNLFIKPYALKNSEGAYLNTRPYNALWSTYIKQGPVVDHVSYEPGVTFDSKGGKVVATYSGNNLTEGAVSFKVKKGNGSSSITPTWTVDDAQHVTVTFDVPANTGKQTESYILNAEINGVTIPSINIKGYDVISVLPEGRNKDESTISSILISGMNNKSDAPDAYETTVDSVNYTNKINVYIRGTNLSSRKTLVKAVDENGVEWPTHPVYECGATIRWQDSSPYLGELDSNNEQVIELLIPRCLGKDHTFKIYFAPDGKNYQDDPCGTVIIHNNGYYDLNEGQFKESDFDLQEFEVRYVDENGKDIAPAEHHKAYGVSELYPYNIAPKEIEGYTLVDSKPYGLSKLEKIFAAPPMNEHGMYANSSHFVNELKGQAVQYVYKKNDTSSIDNSGNSGNLDPVKPVDPGKSDDNYIAENKAVVVTSAKAGKSSVTLKWTKPDKAVKYIVYGNRCGSAKKLRKLTTTSSSSIKIKKLFGKKLVKNKYYKFKVAAVDSDGNVISRSPSMHVIMKGSRKGNYKYTKINNVTGSKLELKEGQEFKLKAAAYRESRGRKVSVHRAVTYISTDPSVVIASRNGRLTTFKRGTCRIYAVAQSGKAAVITVTVK